MTSVIFWKKEKNSAIFANIFKIQHILLVNFERIKYLGPVAQLDRASAF